MSVTTVCPGYVQTEMLTPGKSHPFVVSVDEAVATILKAADARDAVCTFPAPIVAGMRAAQLIAALALRIRRDASQKIQLLTQKERRMAIKLDLVGKKSDPIPFAYTWKDTVLYALGVGAKVDELDFVYEGRGPKVLPTFAVVPSFTSMIAVAGDLGANPMMILHGEQKIILHRPIPASGKLSTVSEVKGIYDKGKGALVVVEATHQRRQGRAGVRQRLLDLRARRRRLRRRARAGGGEGRPAGGRGAGLRGGRARPRASRRCSIGCRAT